MATLSDVTERMATALDGQEGIGRTVKFDLKGDGFIFIDGATVSNADAPADCTLTLSLEDLVALGKGKLDPAMAMMRGRLKVKGDVSVAMKLPAILARVRG